MRVLVLAGRDVDLSAQTLGSIDIDVMVNSYPEQGVAIIEQGNEPDWSWPDYTIVVGTYELGRHKADVVISDTDYIAALVQAVSSILDSMVVDEEDEAGSADV